MSYEDLEPYGLAMGPFDPERAVGWLSPGQPYPIGPTPVQAIDRLFTFVDNPWVAVTRTFGFEPCQLCGSLRSKAPIVVTWRPAPWRCKRRAEVGAAILYVPGVEHVYVAPSMILHFIVAHRYAPPQVFVEAVLACAEPGSAAHRAKLAAFGIRGILGPY